MTFWCTHESQRPAPGSFTRVIIARLIPIALAAAAVGCGGGDEPKPDENRAADVAKEYVHTNSNSEEERCAEVLAAGG
jgi:hypothetical protein